MPFYAYGTDDLTPQSLARVVSLAVEGKIPDALRQWRDHQVKGNRCVCGNTDFDPVCCGFCLTGKLLYMELLHSDSSRGVDYLKTARTVSAHVEMSSATAQAGERFVQPASA